MKFSTLIALVASANAARIMSRETKPAEPVELAETEEAESAEASAAADAQDLNDYDTKSYNYEIQEQNFNGIRGMLGTPTSMTTQLHTMFNQIQFNERVMREIRKIVNSTPELVETLCAQGTDQGGDNTTCECPVGNNILYGAITPEGKIDYMLGFAQDLAESDKTECSNAVFGDPVPDEEKYCWCQTWEGDEVHTTGAAQVFSSHEIAALAQMH